MIQVQYAFLQTIAVVLTLGLALSVPWRRDTDGGLISKERSTELKGAGVLFVIFAHVGYYLVADHAFLFPLSTFAGAGVNLFLFLSGYGLTASMLAHQRTVKEFYVRHARKLYVPLWLTLALFFVADFVVHGHSYGSAYVLRSFLGYFPHADLFVDVDSPLWYFTFAVFLYTFYPIVFLRRWPWFSAFLIAVASYGVALFASPLWDVGSLWASHVFAFPIGMIVAWLVDAWPVTMPKLVRTPAVRLPFLAILFFALWYLTLHAGIGTADEQLLSIATLALIVLFSMLKERRSALLMLLGAYSYEIYLLHWPILARYDLIYRSMPASAATLLYLAIFLVLGYALQRSARVVEDRVWG